MAGDLNQVVDGVLDKSKYSWDSTPEDGAAICRLIEDDGLIDV